MLTSIRAKFAAVLLIGLAVDALALSGGHDASVSVPGGPAMITGVLMLVTMLLIERSVINPITKLTRDIVAVADRGCFDPTLQLTVKGADELATLSRTFNDLIRELSARQLLEKQLEHIAHHDVLTGLPNRLRLRQVMELEIGRLRRGEGLAILCLDLDHFKSVNDALGHSVGDLLLKAVADRLRQTVRETDVVARVGGDEFAVVQAAAELDATEQGDRVLELAARLIETISQPFVVDGHQVVIGMSIGIALSPSDGLEIDQLLRSADMALYRAKADGRGVTRFFEPEMDAKMQARRTLELDLRRALAQGEFELYYQPLIDMETTQVSGFEALVRWNHPTRGLVSPTEFIGVAEEMGLIVPLGEQILRAACVEAAGWPQSIRVAVNLSPVQFKTKGLALAVASALAASGLAPNRLELEITEGVLLQESESTLAILHQLRTLGVRICMDDFGTGYSSLSYLRSFPFDKIKIDQSFVRDMSGDREESLAIVRAVAGLGRSLGMATTAEGVETRAQLGQLRREGCTEVQGFLFSRPMPAAGIPDFLIKVQDELRSAA